MYEFKHKNDVQAISANISTITLVPMRSHKRTNVSVITGVSKVLSLEEETPLVFGKIDV
jgi:hypothetical protein